MRSFTTTLSCIALLASSALALHPVEVRNQEFINSNTGDRVVIVGVDYQPGGSAGFGTGNGDPLSNPEACLRDAVLMQQLGINTIRSYNVDPDLDHDECVSIFNAAGIYMILDVNSPLPGESLESDNPERSYNLPYLERIFRVVEAFKDYPNLLGFFAANEVINQVSNAESTPPYIRAVQRDLKNYIANHADRTIPVGYSAAQVQSVLYDTWAYLQCDISSGSGENSHADFFGLNSYSWCGNASSFTISKYDVLVDWFGNSPIPVFFSEYGCNVPSPRYWNEIPTLYGPQMTSLSGGLAYEWTQEENNYGLVQLRNNGDAELLDDYYAFAQQLSTVDMSALMRANGTATSIERPTCSRGVIRGNQFATSFDIPEPPEGADELIEDGVDDAPSGSLVPVRTTTVSVAVYGTDGARVSNLALNADPNATPPPSSGNGNGDGGDGDGDGDDDSNENAASTVGGGGSLGLVASAAAAAALAVVAFVL